MRFIEVTGGSTTARKMLIPLGSIELVEDLGQSATALSQTQIHTSCRACSVQETYDEVKRLIEKAGERTDE